MEQVNLISRASSTTPPSLPPTPPMSNTIHGNPNRSSNMSLGETTPSLLILARQAACSTFLALVGWYGPRYLISQATGIEDMPAPYVKVGDTIILDFALNQELVEPATIESPFLIMTSVWLPLLFVAAVAGTLNTERSGTFGRAQRKIQNVHAAVCGLLCTIGISEGSTQLLKLYIQRRRPNFFALCGWSNTLLKCTASIDRIRDANFSFPSGHSSLASCGMTYLVWFLLGGLLSSRPNLSIKRLGSLVACVVPLGWAVFVAASRLVDKWHHPADVVAGLLLGGVSASIAYHAWFPSPFGGSAGVPWSMAAGDGKLPSFYD